MVQRIEPGAVNWRTAGRGIVHSERTPEDPVGRERTSHGLQLCPGARGDRIHSAARAAAGLSWSISTLPITASARPAIVIALGR